MTFEIFKYDVQIDVKLIALTNEKTQINDLGFFKMETP